MKLFGRIVGCGMVAEYSSSESEKYGVKNLMHVVMKRITFRGFIVGDKDMGPKYAEEFNKNVSKWIHDGSFTAKMSVTDGIDNAAEGLVGMLQGKNFGKAVLRIADPETKVSGDAARL
jgi:NADPH-dependent curcumin reductase CurA